MSVNKVSNTDGSLTPIATNTSNSLSYLSDVDIISPSTGQILQYDGSKWGNGQPAYQINDTAETNLADDDKIPFYDTSASNKRSSTWSNIKAKLKTYFDSIYATISTVSGKQDKALSAQVEGQSTVEGALGALSRNKVGWDVAGKSVKKNYMPLRLSEIKAVNSTSTWSGDEVTHNGITYSFTTDGDIVKAIKAKGTSTNSQSTLVLTSNADFLTSGDSYILSGCPQDSNNNYGIFLSQSPSYFDYGDGVQFTMDNVASRNVRVFVKKNTALPVEGIMFYPMIRDARISDSTFAPFIYDNTELLSYADNGVLGAKNFYSGSDVNKSSTTSGYYSVTLPKPIKAGTYDVSALVTSSDTTTNKSRISFRTSDGSYISYVDLVANSGKRTNGIITLAQDAYKLYFYGSDNISAISVTATYTDIMIKLATDTDPTYQPYAKTNRELTTDIESNFTGDTLTTKNVSSKVFKALTGSGTAGQDKGSGVSPRYIPALWTFDAGITVANGEVYFIKIPVTPQNYGAWLSLNNGTNYYPVASSGGKVRLQSQYAANTVIAVTYESGSACTCYARTGADATADVTGCFRVLNDYDSGNTNTYVTQTATTTDANYEVLFSATADNTTRTEGARKSAGLKFNPNTGTLTIHREGTTANNYPTRLIFSNKDTTTGQINSSAHIYTYNDHASTSNGENMVISPAGNMFIGSGEAADAHYAANGNNANENFFATADVDMYLQANGQTIANRKGLKINTSHQIVPCATDASTNNIGSIGASSYKWKYGYFNILNGVLTGTGTAGQDKGSGVSPRYIPADWKFNLGVATPADGDVIVITVPVAGTSGVYVSTDNGTTYKPVALNGKTRLTTQYGVGMTIMLVYDVDGVVTTFPRTTGGDTTADVSGGCWRVLNFYDSNTTYSVMSANEAATGTASTARTMSAANLKTILNARINNTLTSTSTTLALSANQGKALNDKITNWTAAQTLSAGATSVTFTGLTSTYAYDLYTETADGTPVYVTGYTVSGTSITYNITAITSAQAGTGGTGCKAKLKCLY